VPLLSVAQTDIVIAYGIRNKGAHDITSSEEVREKFYEINQSILNALLFVVDYLY
jgi:hypothetical protein